MKNIFLGLVTLLLLSPNPASAKVCGSYQLKLESCSETQVEHSRTFEAFVEALMTEGEADTNAIEEFEQELYPSVELKSFIEQTKESGVQLVYNSECNGFKLGFGEQEVLVSSNEGWNSSKKGKLFSKQESDDFSWFEDLRNLVRFKGKVYEELRIKKKKGKIKIEAFKQLKATVRLLLLPFFLNEKGSWSCEFRVQ